jgi:hypothetical protein
MFCLLNSLGGAQELEINLFSRNAKEVAEISIGV